MLSATAAGATAAVPASGPGSAPAAGLPTSMPAVPVCAIIADKSRGLGRSPVVALLEAKLSETGRVRLVERNEIDKILKEQELQLLFAPEGGGRRSALGSLLKADLLVLLRPNEVVKSKKQIDLTICETTAGLRLRVATIRAADKPEDAAIQLAALVDQALGKYRAPIQHIVATPAFVSKDLLHKYDYLKSLYARSADQYLVTQPEIVVVELEEARAIAAELALADKARLVGRQLPYYLMGEYRSSQEGDDLFVSVDLSLHQGEKTLGTRSRAHVPQTEALSFIPAAAWELLRETIGQDGRRIDPATEARQLCERAQVFMRTSNWEEAYCLIEAAVLLQPDDPRLREQAIQLIGTITGGLSVWADPTDEWGNVDPQAQDHYLAAATLVLHYYGTGITHAEKLLTLTDLRTPPKSMFALPGQGLGSIWGRWFRRQTRSDREAEFQKQLAVLRRRQVQMLLRVLRAKVASSGIDLKAAEAFGNALDVEYNRENKISFIEAIQDFPGAAKIILDLVGDNVQSESELQQRDPKHPLSDRLAWHLTDDETISLIDAISRMPGSQTQEAARRLQQLSSRASESLVANELALLKQGLEEAEKSKRDAWVSYRADERTISRRKLTKGALDQLVLERTRDVRPPPQRGEAWLEELSTRCKRGNTVSEAPDGLLLGWMACPQGTDVAWTPNEILAMRRKGVFESLFGSEEAAFGDTDSPYSYRRKSVELSYDGKYVWAPASFAREPHLIAIDLESNRVHRITTAQRLPPMTHGLRLAPLAPGKVFVAAAFGKTGSPRETADRSWGGVVELNADGSATVDVILQGTRVSVGKRFASPNDPEIVFYPRALVPVREPADGPVNKILLLGAALSPLHGAEGFVIDLKTRQVQAAPGPMPTRIANPLPYEAWRRDSAKLRGLLADENAIYQTPPGFGIGGTGSAPCPIDVLGYSCVTVKDGVVHAFAKQGRWWAGRELHTPMRSLKLSLPEYAYRWDRVRLCSSNHYGLVLLAETGFAQQQTYRVAFDEAAFARVDAQLLSDEREQRERDLAIERERPRVEEAMRKLQADRDAGIKPAEVQAAERRETMIIVALLIGIPVVAVAGIWALTLRRSAKQKEAGSAGADHSA